MRKLVSLVYAGKPDSLLWRRSMLPTTALYFLNACVEAVLRGTKEGGIDQVGANTFRTDRVNLVIRQDLPEVVAAALNDRTRKLVYLIDDNVQAYATDAGLPAPYRRRLGERWERIFQPLLRRSAEIVVSSDYLRHHLSGFGSIRRADPIWHRDLLAEMSAKLQRPAAADGRLRVAVLGTASHQAEAAFLVPVLIALLQQRPGIMLTLPAGSLWPDALTKDPRVQLRWPVPWFEYEDQLMAEHYDLCLYPAIDGPFSAARSRNKLTEHALAGAFGLYSASWAHADTVRETGAGGLARNHPDDWTAAALQALEGLAEWRSDGAAVADRIQALNSPAPQQQMWRDLLGIEVGA